MSKNTRNIYKKITLIIHTSVFENEIIVDRLYSQSKSLETKK